MANEGENVVPISDMVAGLSRTLERSFDAPSLKGGGDGGTSGGMSDDWKDSVNNQLTQLHGDVRHLLYGLIAGVLILAGAGWTAYNGLSSKTDGLQKEIADLRVSQAQTTEQLKSVNEKLDRLLDDSSSPATK